MYRVELTPGGLIAHGDHAPRTVTPASATDLVPVIEEEEFRTEIGITLIEFLKAVFWELTYLGTPEERDAMRSELEERRRRLDAGEEQTIPAEQVFREFR